MIKIITKGSKISKRNIIKVLSIVKNWFEVCDNYSD